MREGRGGKGGTGRRGREGRQRVQGDRRTVTVALYRIIYKNKIRITDRWTRSGDWPAWARGGGTGGADTDGVIDVITAGGNGEGGRGERREEGVAMREGETQGPVVQLKHKSL